MRAIDADLLKKRRFPSRLNEDGAALVAYSDVLLAIDQAPTLESGFEETGLPFKVKVGADAEIHARNERAFDDVIDTIGAERIKEAIGVLRSEILKNYKSPTFQNRTVQRVYSMGVKRAVKILEKM